MEWRENKGPQYSKILDSVGHRHRVGRRSVTGSDKKSGGAADALTAASPSSSSPTTTKGPAYVRGNLRLNRSKRPRRKGSKFHIPGVTQRAALGMPEVRDWWIARERQIKLDVARKLIGGGISMNHVAKLLGVHLSWLSVTLPCYEREGFAALLPKLRGKVGRKPAAGKRMKPGPCRISFQVYP